MHELIGIGTLLRQSMEQQDGPPSSCQVGRINAASASDILILRWPRSAGCVRAAR